MERCKELIESGYDVNTPDAETVTLLHWAAINNRKDIIKYYISLGAVVDAVGGELQSTPLHWATRLVKIKISRRANLVLTKVIIIYDMAL